MNFVSDLPITTKIRMGTKDNKPTASKLLARLHSEGSVSMVTLHGRSRQQRYSRKADWSYIAACASQIKSYTKEVDNYDLKAPHDIDKMGFIGNGDVYTFEDWNAHMESGVDGCMIARGHVARIA